MQLVPSNSGASTSSTENLSTATTISASNGKDVSHADSDKRRTDTPSGTSARKMQSYAIELIDAGYYRLLTEF